MALMPCAYCHRVPKARLYTLIWAWQAEDERIAVKTRTCLADLAEAVRFQDGALEEDGDYVQLPTNCPACQEPLGEQDLALTWLTYWDSDGAHKPSYAHCHACASRLRAALIEVGELMADRPLQNRRRGP